MNKPTVQKSNPIAKNAWRFNRCRVMRDHKKQYCRRAKHPSDLTRQ